MSNKYSEALLTAIDIIAEKKVSTAKYDKTIIAEIVKLLDAKQGKYLLRYENAFIEAFSNINQQYTQGELVYILIPQGDMTENKQIVGVINASKAENKEVILWENTKGVIVENNQIIGYVDLNGQQIFFKGGN